MHKIICEAHGLRMEEAGESKRGLPQFFCPKGCQIEEGQAEVKRVFPDRGYGFLRMPENGDLFFHFSQLDGMRTVEAGELLGFRVGVNDRTGKLQAVNIQRTGQDKDRVEEVKAIAVEGPSGHIYDVEISQGMKVEDLMKALEFEPRLLCQNHGSWYRLDDAEDLYNVVDDGEKLICTLGPSEKELKSVI